MLSALHEDHGTTLPSAHHDKRYEPPGTLVSQQFGDPEAGRKVAANIIYTKLGGRPQMLDVYVPSGTSPAEGWPVVLAIHGGGWHKFSKDEYAPHVVPELTRNGYAVVTPNYTLSTRRKPSWPWNIEQLEQAVLWIKGYAVSYHLDSSRIAAMGESAGGHLAALLGTSSIESASSASSAGVNTMRIQAVIDFYGPVDLTALEIQSPIANQKVQQFLGSEDPSLYAVASPIRNVKLGDPPVLILQGLKDWIVPPAQAIAYAATLTADGVPNRLVLIPGVGHGFGFQAGGQNLLPEVIEFLHEAL